MRHVLIAPSAAITALNVGNPGFAQTAAAVPRSVIASAERPVLQAEGSSLVDIVLTAQRRSASSRRPSVAIDVVSAGATPMVPASLHMLRKNPWR